jgi:methionine-rich copper-binding protein CopC
MITRRHCLLAGAPAILLSLIGPARAQELRVLDSAPQANAVIGGRSSAFYVRFNRPVDHEDSRLAIKQDGRIIEVLHPRLESAPEVLFARAPTLAPGRYSLHWLVGGSPQADGEIPFTVGSGS